MADTYWRYAADPRQQQQQQQPPPPPGGPYPGAPPAASQMSAAAAGGQQQPMKRPRATEFSDAPGAPDMTGYYPRDEEKAGYHAARDSVALNAAYERFLRTGKIQSYGAGPGGEPIRPAVGGNAGGYPVDDRPTMAARSMDSRNVGYGGAMTERPLPPDASNTLFIEGVPTDCTRREVSHIFRPFVGFSEVRLVNKEPKHPGGDPIVLCFVDFADAAQAAIALEALQGYKFDEHDHNSPHLRLQFARFTGPRGNSGPGGARFRR